MFGFLKKRSPTLPSPSHPDSQKSALASTYKPSTISVSNHDLRLELVRTVLRDTVRHHGLPPDWLRAELTVPTGASANGPLHIRIIMTKWNGTLLKYSMALERLILTGMDRYDPAVDHSGYTVSWQFAKGAIGNTHFVAIPYNARAKSGAQLVANFLLSPAAQARKADITQWGDPTVLNVAALPATDRQLFSAVARPGEVATTAPTLPEPHASWVDPLEKAWTQRYAK